jgi:PIN domain nuclease of toxin-antitoxin system
LKLLLDTRALIWFLDRDEHLGDTARRHLTDQANRVLLSAAVVWEISLKGSLGKLSLPEDYVEQLFGVGVQALPITAAHASAVERLPWHHRDPFDRMLIAQASVEGAGLVTRDDAMRPYDITLIW